MTYREEPHFIIKKNLQKSKVTGVYFCDVVTPIILNDVCYRITGLRKFTYEYVDNDYYDEFLDPTYNKGRIAILQYKDSVIYITFSEKEIGGRNSSVQSVATAFNMYYTNPYPKKDLYYYFLNVNGNPETEYHILMYRLMRTIGFKFLNVDHVLRGRINIFNSIEDIMMTRRVNSGQNRSNNSTYITKSGLKTYDVYGKTYGANKYETSMICYALSLLARNNDIITLYEVLEQDLKELPATCLNVIKMMGIIDVKPTDMQLERQAFLENNSLRSPRYIFNLLDRLGSKHCAFCNCELPELIQGAHVWAVADIKKQTAMPLEAKLQHAINGHNGLWLCENHHKMFDENLITINNNGRIEFNTKVERKHIAYMQEITNVSNLPDDYMSDSFVRYLELRNRAS